MERKRRRRLGWSASTAVLVAVVGSAVATVRSAATTVICAAATVVSAAGAVVGAAGTPFSPAATALSAVAFPATLTTSTHGTSWPSGLLGSTLSLQASPLTILLAWTDVVTVDYSPTSQTLHVGLFLAATLTLLAVGYWILSTRQTRGAGLFAAALVLASVRTGLDVFHVVVGEFWGFHRAILGGALVLQLLVVLLFVRFAGRYADEPRLVDDRSKRVSVVLLAVAVIAILTNRWHDLVFAAYDQQSEPFVHLGTELGSLGWLFVGLTFALMLLGAGLLARSFTVAERPDWWSAAMLTMGICLTAVVVVLDLLGQLPLSTFDYGGVALVGFLLLTTPALLGHGLRRIEISARESMLRELDDPIVIVDDKRRIVDYTEAAHSLLPSGARGRYYDDVLDYDHEWPNVGETVTTEVDRSAVVSAADDEPQYYLAQASPVTSETGDVIGYTVRFADVTDLKRRTAELARKNEQLDQFADTISHDLREPLSIASEHVRRLEAAVGAAGPDDTLDAASIHEHLEAIERALERMGHIIDDLLALARDTDTVADVETVSFGAVVDQAWTLVDPRLGDLHVDGGGGTIDADPECLQRVFENLFRLFADDGGEPPTPDADRSGVESTPDNVQVVAGLTGDGFYVSADGAVLPETASDTGLDGAAESPGHRCLELSIVEHLVDAHGWTVGVRDVGSGVRVEVTGAETSSGEPLEGEAS